MATVLLITDEPRLRRLFAPLEAKKPFRLRVAATLAQAEEECAFRPPSYVFADSSSGLAPAALVEYLRTIVGEGAEIVIFSATGQDAVATPAASEYRTLDPFLDDEILQQALLRIIPSGPSPDASQAVELPPAHPGSARELLFSKPVPSRRFTVNWLLWCIPPALVVFCVWVFALSGDKQPTQQATTRLAVPAPVPTAAPAAPPVQEPSQRPAQRPAQAVGKKKPAATTGKVPRQPAEAEAEPAAAPEAAPAGEPHSYLVQRNDTLIRVMTKQYGYSYHEVLALIPELRRLNKSVDLNKLKPGQQLNIPPHAPLDEPVK